MHSCLGTSNTNNIAPWVHGADTEKLALFAASQHHLNDKLVQALARIDDLEYENAELREELAKLKRSKIVPIK